MRVPREHHRHVDDGHTALISDGNPLERLDHLLDFGRRIRLCGHNDDVLTALAAPPTFVEQLERLADASGVAKKDLQLSSLFGSLGGFDLTKNGLGVAGTRAIVAINTHAMDGSPHDCIRRANEDRLGGLVQRPSRNGSVTSLVGKSLIQLQVQVQDVDVRLPKETQRPSLGVLRHELLHLLRRDSSSLGHPGGLDLRILGTDVRVETRRGAGDRVCRNCRFRHEPQGRLLVVERINQLHIVESCPARP